VEAPVLLAIGVGLVARVDDRAVVRGRARDLLIDVLRPLADAVVHAVLGLEHLPGAGIDLARHQEGNQLLGEVVEVDVAVDEEVLVAAVAVADEVRVVLEDGQPPRDALLADLLFGVVLQILEDALTGLVEDDQLARRGALGRGVLGVAARVLVEAGPVLEEDVEEVLGGDQLLEQEADGLLDREGLAPLGREDDPVFRLEPEDAFLHRVPPRPAFASSDAACSAPPGRVLGP
jgi:hypothetical protein